MRDFYHLMQDFSTLDGPRAWRWCVAMVWGQDKGAPSAHLWAAQLWLAISEQRMLQKPKVVPVHFLNTMPKDKEG